MRGGGSFETILTALGELGYNVEWQVLNSKYFGVPQDRARVFLVGHLRGTGSRPIFPLGNDSSEADGVQGQQTVTNTLTARYPEAQRNGSYIVEGQQPSIKLAGNLNPSGKGMNGNVYRSDGLSPTLTTNKGEGVKIIQRAHGFNKGGIHHLAPTLTSASYHENNFVYDLHNGRKKDMVGTLTASGHSGSTSIGTFGVTFGQRIRKLTPKECWRLQGFPDWAFEKAQQVNSNSQLYKQAGNSVTVSVVTAIAKQLR